MVVQVVRAVATIKTGHKEAGRGAIIPASHAIIALEVMASAGSRMVTGMVATSQEGILVISEAREDITEARGMAMTTVGIAAMAMTIAVIAGMVMTTGAIAATETEIARLATTTGAIAATATEIAPLATTTGVIAATVTEIDRMATTIAAIAAMVTEIDHMAMTTEVMAALATEIDRRAMTIAVVATAMTTEDMAMTIGEAMETAIAGVMAATTGDLAMIIPEIRLMADTAQEEILTKRRGILVRDLPQKGHQTGQMKKRNPINLILTNLTNRRINKIKNTFDQLFC